MSRSMQNSHTRKKVKVCNIIIACLCLLSILSYLIFPFWKIEISYTLNGETISKLFSMVEPPASEAQTAFLAEQSSESTQENSLSSLNVAELLGDEEITLGLSVSLTTADAVSSLTQEPTQAVENIIKTNVDSLVEQVTSQAIDTVKSLLTDFIPLLVETYISMMTPTISEDLEISEQAARDLFLKSGFTVERMQTLAQNLLDALLSETLTAERLTDVAAELMIALGDSMSINFTRTAIREGIVSTTVIIEQETNSLLSDFYNEPYLAGYRLENTLLTYPQKTLIKNCWHDYQNNPDDFSAKFLFEDSIRTAFTDFYDKLVNDEQFYNDTHTYLLNLAKESFLPEIQKIEEAMLKKGYTFTGENFLYFFIIPELEKGLSHFTTIAPTNTPISALTLNTTNMHKITQANVSPKAELQEKLRALIVNTLPENAISTIATAMQWISYFILFTMLIWLYPIIKITLKWGAKNNTVKLKAPIWLGCFPFLILQALPMLVVFLITSPPAWLLNPIIGTEATAQLIQVSATLVGLHVSFVSCAWVSFVVSTFFVFFSIFYYAPLRRRLKKMKKGKIPVD